MHARRWRFDAVQLRGGHDHVPHVGSGPPAGYRLFNFTPAQGQEWALQIVTKFPPDTGEADPGWWASTPTWKWEWDMFEGWGWGGRRRWEWCQPGKYVGTTDSTFIYSTSSLHNVQGVNSFCRDFGFDPSAGYHTYTTVMYPDRSMAEYIDGRLVTFTYGSANGSQTVTGLPQVPAVMGGRSSATPCATPRRASQTRTSPPVPAYGRPARSPSTRTRPRAAPTPSTLGSPPAPRSTDPARAGRHQVLVQIGESIGEAPIVNLL